MSTHLVQKLEYLLNDLFFFFSLFLSGIVDKSSYCISFCSWISFSLPHVCCLRQQRSEELLSFQFPVVQFFMSCLPCQDGTLFS